MAERLPRETEDLFDELGVESPPRDIGGDRARTGTVLRVTTKRWGVAVLKIPNHRSIAERYDREAAMLTLLEMESSPSTPALLKYEPGTIASNKSNMNRHGQFLLMNELPGRPGDAAIGLLQSEVQMTLRAIAPLHAAWWNRSPHALELPRWGSGSRNSSNPHERRIRRYQNRCVPFLNRLQKTGAFLEDDEEGILSLMHQVQGSLAEDIASLTSGETTLIHGDLHPENLLFSDGAPSVIDWQTASIGPVMQDIVRLSAEALRGPDAASDMIDVIEEHLHELERLGVHPDAIDGARGAIDSCLRLLFAGVVSGYGTDAPLTPRDETVARVHASRDGLAGILSRHFKLDIRLPRAPQEEHHHD
ncbi:MAG: aminoglycoside phosphotransferase family protein [Phycisphaerales bacterium]|nr:aminoglycoside phosphotransferase family protein [Phycisphaerales bacterium]